jgi:hypothetical protein
LSLISEGCALESSELGELLRGQPFSLLYPTTRNLTSYLLHFKKSLGANEFGEKCTGKKCIKMNDPSSGDITTYYSIPGRPALGDFSLSWMLRKDTTGDAQFEVAFMVICVSAGAPWLSFTEEQCTAMLQYHYSPERLNESASAKRKEPASANPDPPPPKSRRSGRWDDSDMADVDWARMIDDALDFEVWQQLNADQMQAEEEDRYRVDYDSYLQVRCDECSNDHEKQADQTKEAEKAPEPPTDWRKAVLENMQMEPLMIRVPILLKVAGVAIPKDTEVFRTSHPCLDDTDQLPLPPGKGGAKADSS